jgi:hypothetical protein
MRRFEYRAPRFPADVSVKLDLQDSAMSGRCVQISLDGMRGKFDKPLQQKALGTVTIAYRDVLIDVPVQVAHSTPTDEGLTFLFDSDHQRNSVKRLIGLISETPAPRSLVLVK